jgi:5,10-methylene-tetrahydrofolate dehydrogenase/methenyl tetrahydrofolate cyclohydrolase
MPAQLMLGKPVVEAILAPLEQEQVESTLAVVQVGGRKESNSYIKQLTKTAERITQMGLEHHLLDDSASPERLYQEITDLNRRPEVGGYMLQLPLPEHLQSRMNEIRSWIEPSKDLEVLGYTQRGMFFSEAVPGQLLPPTPYGVMKMLRVHQVNMRGKIAVIVGDGLVGEALKVMMGHDKLTQIVCNETTPDISSLTRMGDIVVGAAGVPNIVTGDMVKDGAVVINVGMKFNTDTNKMDGDIDVESVQQRASLVTPVMGGSGPVTVAALVQNLFRAVRLAKAKRL